MTLLIIGLVLFLGIHSISIVAPAQRERLRARLGEQRWKGLYSVISLVGFVLLIKGYADARALPELLYSPPQWTRHLMALLMLPVFPLLFAGNLPGRIKSAVVHPMLTATILWSAAHLLGNTTRADALLFGGFLVWAVADLISALRRPRRPLRPAMVSRWNDLIAVGGGLVVYVVFVLWLHRLLIGIAPFAR